MAGMLERLSHGLRTGFAVSLLVVATYATAQMREAYERLIVTGERFRTAQAAQLAGDRAVAVQLQGFAHADPETPGTGGSA